MQPSRNRRRQHIFRRTTYTLSMVLIVVACNGNGLSPEAYFDGLNLETEKYGRTLDTLTTTYGEELDAELGTLQDGSDFTDTSSVDAFFDQAKEVAIVKTAELFSNSSAELRSFLDVLVAMEPPEAFVESHQDFVAAGEALAAAMPLTIESVRSLSAIEDLDETLVQTPYTVASQRFTIACENLEAAAVAQEIEIDLECPTGPATVATE